MHIGYCGDIGYQKPIIRKTSLMWFRCSFKVHIPHICPFLGTKKCINLHQNGQNFALLKKYTTADAGGGEYFWYELLCAFCLLITKTMKSENWRVCRCGLLRFAAEQTSPTSSWISPPSCCTWSSLSLWIQFLRVCWCGLLFAAAQTSQHLRPLSISFKTQSKES